MALQVVVSGAGTLGYLGADFDLRSLPVTSRLYQEPDDWRQVKDATIPRTEIARNLAAMRGLRTIDTTIYLRTWVHALQELEQTAVRGKDQGCVLLDDGLVGLHGPCELIERDRDECPIEGSYLLSL